MKLFIAESNNTQNDERPLFIVIAAKNETEARQHVVGLRPNYIGVTFHSVEKKEGILFSIYEFDPMLELGSIIE